MALILFRKMNSRSSAVKLLQQQYAAYSTKTAPKETTTKKKPKSGLYRMRLEDEMLFGKLLETDKQRAKSLNIVDKTKTSVPKSKTSSAKPKAKLDIIRYTAHAHGSELVEEVVKTRKPRTTKPKEASTDVSEAGSTSKVPVETATAPTDHSKTEKTLETSASADTEPEINYSKEATPGAPQVEPEEKPMLQLPEFLQLEPCKPIRHQYPFDPEWVRVPSVTKILSATMAPEQKQILERWEKKKIAELGLAGFHAYKADLFLNGKDLHANIAEVLTGVSEQFIMLRQPVQPYWDSVRSVLATMRDVQVLESFTQHPELGYCGVVDCIAKYKDKLVLIDWKTSERSKPVLTMTYDTPLQIAAYIGAINADPQYNIEVKEGLIVMTYKTGQISDVFHLRQNDIDYYWSQWTRRLEQFKTQEAEALAAKEKKTEEASTPSEAQ